MLLELAGLVLDILPKQDRGPPSNEKNDPKQTGRFYFPVGSVLSIPTSVLCNFTAGSCTFILVSCTFISGSCTFISGSCTFCFALPICSASYESSQNSHIGSREMSDPGDFG